LRFVPPPDRSAPIHQASTCTSPSLLKLLPPSTARSVNVVVFFPEQQLGAAEHILSAARRDLSTDH